MGKEKIGFHDFILSAFRKKFGNMVIGLNLLPLGHECWATIIMKEKNEEIEKMAREMESEFREELGLHISIFIKVPLKNRIKRFALKVWKV
jgi:hypothetical protein